MNIHEEQYFFRLKSDMMKNLLSLSTDHTRDRTHRIQVLNLMTKLIEELLYIQETLAKTIDPKIISDKLATLKAIGRKLI